MGVKFAVLILVLECLFRPGRIVEFFLGDFGSGDGLGEVCGNFAFRVGWIEALSFRFCLLIVLLGGLWLRGVCCLS